MGFRFIIRSILKRKITSLVIFASLTIALTTVILLSGYLFSEWQVDKSLDKEEQIFRLSTKDLFIDETGSNLVAWDAPKEIKDKFPEVLYFCRNQVSTSKSIFVNYVEIPAGLDIFVSSPSFFKIFDFPLLYGDKNNVLSLPGNIVLKESIALKYFGTTELVGKNIMLKDKTGNKNYVVSGIISDSKIRTRFGFDLITSDVRNTAKVSSSYLLLKDKEAAQSLENKLHQNQKALSFYYRADNVHYHLESFTSIYFQGETRTKWYFTLAVGILVLLIATFNYLNLVWVHMLERRKELSVRKIIGGRGFTIKKIFIIELFAIILFSLISSLIFSFFILPYFNILIGIKFTPLHYINKYVGIAVLLVIAIIILATWIILGLGLRQYLRTPSAFLTKDSLAKKKQLPVLNILQFSVSSLLILITIVVLKQIHYIHHKDIGINRDIYNISIPDNTKAQSFKNELIKFPTIKNISVCENSPLLGDASVQYKYEKEGQTKEYIAWLFRGDNNYIPILGINITEGTNFSKLPDENINKCIINKALKKELNLENPIGKVLPGSNSIIIGVVDDFHWNSLQKPIFPATITYLNSSTSIGLKFSSGILVEFIPEMEHEGLSQLKSCWNNFFPRETLAYSTIGDQFNAEHKAQQDYLRNISTFSAISIFLSCIGLFAISLFTIKNSTKQIGIRKVNGAKTNEIILMLNIDFIKWVMIAFIIACPIAWFAMTKWLENFVYKTEISWWIFALAGAIALVIALFTISWQSWRAASRNPVESLRYE